MSIVLLDTGSTLQFAKNSLYEDYNGLPISRSEPITASPTPTGSLLMLSYLAEASANICATVLPMP